MEKGLASVLCWQSPGRVAQGASRNPPSLETFQVLVSCGGDCTPPKNPGYKSCDNHLDSLPVHQSGHCFLYVEGREECAL